MILVALGGNLDSKFGTPRETQLAAMARLEELGNVITNRARFYKTAPVPVSDQPWYVNTVIEIATDLLPQDLLGVLQCVEREFGRERTGSRNDARVIDLDLIAYYDWVIDQEAEDGRMELIVPHPRMDNRAFVLLPIRDIAPDWKHPVSGKALAEMIAKIPEDQQAIPMGEDEGKTGEAAHA